MGVGVTSLRIASLIPSLIVIAACSSASDPGASKAAPDNTALERDSISSNTLIHLVDQLDEPEYYCIDVVGVGLGVLLQEPLHAHTCKSTQNLDQLFTTDQPLAGQIYMEAYDLCVQSGAVTRGSSLYLQPCSDSPLQRFVIAGDGTIRLDDDGPDSLCVAVAPGEGEDLAFRRHMRRDLSLEACHTAEPNLMKWSFSEESPAQDS